MSYNVIGGMAWVTICTVTGYVFGQLPAVKEHFELVVLAIIGLSLVPAIWEMYNARKRKRQGQPPAPLDLPSD
jgi:membrane-associated protein